MKKTFSICFLISIISIVTAQDEYKVYDTLNNGAYHLYIDNDAYCPITINADFDLTNLKSSNGNHKIFVVPSRTKKYLITTLTTISKFKSISYNAKTQNFWGDGSITKYDEDFLYFLPFKKGSKYNVFQGYNGSNSHKGENALDFTMPIGTEISAIRGGIVIKVVSEFDKGCKSESCRKYNNYITIYHNDGTYAVYAHIQKNGNLVKVGDIVKQGDLIAKSGNTGYSTGPHLHLAVYKQKKDKNETLSTKFMINDGVESELLKEGKTYERDY